MNQITGIYIDGANLYCGAEELGYRVDYKKFRGWLRQKFGDVKVYLFLGLIPSMVSLYQHIQECGYIIVFKETVSDGKGKIKGNCDAELVLKVVSDLFEHSVQRFILVTGDGDFRCLVDFLVQRQMSVAILAPNQNKCSILLKRSSAQLTDMAELYQKFAHKNKKAPDKDVSL